MDKQKQIAVIASLLIAVSITALGISSLQKSSYEDLRSTSQSSSYHINYEVDVADNIDANLINYDKFELYSDQGVQRQETAWSMDHLDVSNTQISYLYGNNSLRCKKLDSGEINSSSCRIDDTDLSSFHDLGKNADKHNLTRKDTHEIAGRQCQRFRFKTNTNNTLAGDRLEGPAQVDVCLDKELGYIAALSITGNVSDFLQEETTRTTIMNIEAKEVDTSYNKQVKPPISLAATGDCYLTEPKIKILPLKEVSEVTIEVNKHNLTYNPEKHQVNSYKLPKDNLEIDAENPITVYTSEGEKTTATCSYFRLNPEYFDE